MSNSSVKINLEDYINSFSWNKRIVLLISKTKYIDLINETNLFFKKIIVKMKQEILNILVLLEMILINILFQIDIRINMEFG